MMSGGRRADIEVQLDAQRSRDWTTALLRYAVAQDPAMADVVGGWLATWQPRSILVLPL